MLSNNVSTSFNSFNVFIGIIRSNHVIIPLENRTSIPAFSMKSRPKMISYGQGSSNTYTVIPSILRVLSNSRSTISLSETVRLDKKFPAMVLKAFLVCNVGVAPFGRTLDRIIVCDPPESKRARRSRRLSCDCMVLAASNVTGILPLCSVAIFLILTLGTGMNI